MTADTVRTAACRCGALRAACTGEPERVSVCHCHDCQRRSGSAFAAQARWPSERVTVSGEPQSWTHVADSGRSATFLFCPTCGATVAYTNEALPGLTAVPVGALAGAELPLPVYSVYEARKYPWVEIVGDGIEHFD